MNSTPCRPAPSHTSDRLLEHGAQINLQRVRDAKQGVDGGQAFALLHAHDHRVAEAGARGDFVEGKLLPDALCLNQFSQPGNDRFTLRSFRHICVLCDESLDEGYDHRHNPVLRSLTEWKIQ